MKEHFIAGARGRARRSLEYQVAVQVIRSEVRAEYQPLLAQAGLLGKARLWVQRRRRIEREIEALAPGDAYYSR